MRKRYRRNCIRAEHVVGIRPYDGNAVCRFCYSGIQPDRKQSREDSLPVGPEADIVIRMPTGGGLGAGPFHSQSNEAWFTHTPGLKVVYPSTAYDAKGLLIAAINDPNPVLFFEHKALYRSISDEVPAEYYEIEIGKASHVWNRGRHFHYYLWKSGSLGTRIW